MLLLCRLRVYLCVGLLHELTILVVLLCYAVCGVVCWVVHVRVCGLAWWRACVCVYVIVCVLCVFMSLNGWLRVCVHGCMCVLICAFVYMCMCVFVFLFV